jgi:ABC-type sugar transport system substrate-binding protein
MPRKQAFQSFFLDRNVDQSLAKAGEDYVTFIGSDFIEEGRRAAEWLTKTMNGQAKIIELQGTVGSSPANDRRDGRMAGFQQENPLTSFFGESRSKHTAGGSATDDYVIVVLH